MPRPKAPKGWSTSVSTTSRKRRSSNSAPSHDFTDKSRGPRLQKVLADAGVASRRDCEALIEAGEVAVNGHIVRELPAWVDPTKDRISVGGKIIHTKPRPSGTDYDNARSEYVYIMLFKPRGVVSTNEDPEGRTRAIDLVKHKSKARLYPVGRLDIESSGLLLLTNDGELANRLTHPRYGIHKVYEVTVAGAVDETEVKKLERGLFLTDARKANTRGRKTSVQGSKTAQSRLKLIKRDRDRTRLLMELREGRNRQIRRMMADLGHQVKKLRRVQMGPLRLRGLQPSQWRELTPKELIALRKAAFEDGEKTAQKRKQRVTPQKRPSKRD